MTQFADLIEAQVLGATVRDAFLGRFGFKSGEMRLWTGLYPLTDNNGEKWTGIGNMGAVSAISSGPGQGMDEVTLTLAGDAGMLAKFTQAADETGGQDFRLYQQFFDVRDFDAAGNWTRGKPLDQPLQIFWGTMGPLIVDRPVSQAGIADPRQRLITVRAVNAFMNRRKPPFGYYSNQDQLARSVGGNDNFCINVSQMALATVRWPKFA